MSIGPVVSGRAPVGRQHRAAAAAPASISRAPSGPSLHPGPVVPQVSAPLQLSSRGLAVAITRGGGRWHARFIAQANSLGQSMFELPLAPGSASSVTVARQVFPHLAPMADAARDIIDRHRASVQARQKSWQGPFGAMAAATWRSR